MVPFLQRTSHLNSSGGEVDEYLDDKAAACRYVACRMSQPGIEIFMMRISLNWYPNPSKDNFYIDLNDIQMFR